MLCKEKRRKKMEIVYFENLVATKHFNPRKGLLKPKQTDSGDELWESFPFLNKATVKTDNKYVQIVLQHYSRKCKKWKPVLCVLPPTFKPVVQQIKAAASCVILTSDWIKSYRSHAILDSYVTCCKPSLSWASKTRNMYRFCFSKK